MEKILELLDAKDEEEAIKKIQLLAAPSIGVMIVATVDGGIQLSTSGPATPDIVQGILLEAAKMVLEKSKAQKRQEKSVPTSKE